MEGSVLLYIVTGCAGFIGSTLSDRLLRDGNEVIGIDCFRDYYNPSLKRSNIIEASQSKAFKLIELDLSRDDLPDVTELTGGSPFVIHHLAAQAGVRKSWGSEFSNYTRDNITATQRLLEWCLKADNLQNLVYASSSSVYGNVKILPMHEDTTIPRPFSPYGVTKLAAENLVFLYHTNYGLPVVSCRFFTVYGPRQRPDMAFNKFIHAGFSDQPIIIYGDGEQTRDFTFVDDIVEGLHKAEINTEGSIFNLAGGTRVTLNQALFILQKVMRTDLRITREKNKLGDVRDTCASTSKAREKLGWKSTTSLEDGLSAEYSWLRSHIT